MNNLAKGFAGLRGNVKGIEELIYLKREHAYADLTKKITNAKLEEYKQDLDSVKLEYNLVEESIRKELKPAPSINESEFIRQMKRALFAKWLPLFMEKHLYEGYEMKSGAQGTGSYGMEYVKEWKTRINSDFSRELRDELTTLGIASDAKVNLGWYASDNDVVKLINWATNDFKYEYKI